MIDARAFNTSEELANAMLQEYRSQIAESIGSRYKCITNHIDWLNKYIGDEMTDAIMPLKKNTLYYTADIIEECAYRIAECASSIKSICRLIPEENRNEN